MVPKFFAIGRGQSLNIVIDGDDRKHDAVDDRSRADRGIENRFPNLAPDHQPLMHKF